MGFTVTFDEEKNLVCAKISGELRAEITGSVAVEGIKLARQNESNKFLVDMTQTVVRDSVMDSYVFMVGLEALGFLVTDRIAIVYQADEARHQFSENVARNRGWWGIRYFADLVEAKKWLDT